MQILKAVYFPNVSFLEAKKGSNPSWIWTSILAGRNLLEKGVRFNVTSGSNINIWKDPWVPSLDSFKIQSLPPAYDQSCPTLVTDLIDLSTGSWSDIKLSSFFSPLEQSAIKIIPVSVSQRPDRWVWHFSKNGSFSVKSAYSEAVKYFSPVHMNEASSSFHPSKKIWKVLWAMYAPPKIKSFWWKVCVNAIPTRENLWRRKCNSDPRCVRCGLEPESAEHVIFRCHFAIDVWRKMQVVDFASQAEVFCALR